MRKRNLNPKSKIENRKSKIGFILHPSSFILVFLLLAGCGRSPHSPQTGAASGGEKSTLRFLSMDYDPASSALQRKIVEEFNKQNTEGQVQIEIVNWNDGHQKLQTLISGNQAPDLAIVGTRWMAEYAQAGLLADLDDASHQGVDLSAFIPGVLESGRIAGKLVGLPVAASVRGLYYNKALLDKASVAPPRTWTELETAAHKVQAADPGVAGIGVQGKEVETDLYFYYFVWGANGEILTPGGKCALNSPQGVEALNFELSLVKNGLTEAQPTGYNREDLQNLFKAGKVAMIMTGPWFAGMLKKEMPSLPFGVSYIPGKSGPVVPAVADEIVMFNSVKDKSLAWKFLAFWYRDANRLAWAQASGMLPEKQTVARDPALTTDAERRFFMEALPKGRYVPTHPRWEQMANAVSEEVQRALLGQTDARGALQSACEQVDNIAASR